MLGGDLSVAEIGDELGMTRQGAYDLVRRSLDHLEGIERGLRLCEIRGRYESLAAIIRESKRDLPEEFMSRVAGLLALEEGSTDV
jgi:predicted DNA-binding protein YlxM (UPF0122 family)